MRNGFDSVSFCSATPARDANGLPEIVLAHDLVQAVLLSRKMMSLYLHAKSKRYIRLSLLAGHSYGPQQGRCYRDVFRKPGQGKSDREFARAKFESTVFRTDTNFKSAQGGVAAGKSPAIEPISAVSLERFELSRLKQASAASPFGGETWRDERPLSELNVFSRVDRRLILGF